MKPLFASFKSSSLDVLSNLKERYGLLLRHDLVSARIVHKDARVVFEVTLTDKDNYSFTNKVVVRSLSLDELPEGSFSVNQSVFDNGRLLVEELPPTTLARLADIFDESAAAAIINYRDQA